ncbi:MAG: hypothetical protein ABSG45_03485 [Nitrososphaerales archaeon]|jgi:hypothetical protein
MSVTATVVFVVAVIAIGAVSFVLLTSQSLSPASIQTSSTPSTGPLVSYSTPANYLVEVIAFTGPVPPYPIGEFEVSISLINVGDTPITSLNAVLSWIPPPGTSGGAAVQYSFDLNVSSLSPLLPSQIIQKTSAFMGPDLEGGLHYPLTISGTLKDGTQFSFTENVLFVRFDL